MFVCLLLAVGCVWGCGHDMDPQTAAFPIGLMTTEVNGQYLTDRLVAERVVERVNAAGGLLVGDRRYVLELHHQLSGLTQESALQSAQRLFNQERVSVLVGPSVSSFAAPVAELAERAGVPMITPYATYPGVTWGKRFVFGVAADDDQRARLLAQFVRQEMPRAKTGVLFNVTKEFSRAFAKTFQEEMENLGGSIVVAEFTGDSSDFRPQLEGFREGAVDVLLLPNYPVMIQHQMEQIQELGWQVQVLGTDSWYIRETYDADLYEGTLLGRLAHLEEATEGQRAELEEILTEIDMWANDAAILNYDALHLLFDALQRCACTDGPGLRDALAATRDYRGVSGKISLGSDREMSGRLALVRVTQGRTDFYRALTTDSRSLD